MEQVVERKAKPATIRKRRWDNKTYRRFRLDVNKSKYPEIVEKLESEESINGYLISLILKDLEKK